MALSIFALDPQFCEGIFFCEDATEFLDMTFYRATVSSDNIGQPILSFASHLVVRGSLQPEADGYPRYMQGTLEEANYRFIVLGNPAVLVGDRTQFASQALEAMAVDHWGNFQTEIKLVYVR